MGAGAWLRFSTVFVTVAGALLIGLLALAYAVDPYDTGRSSLFSKPGIRPQGPRTAAASRGRDPAFNAAIVGNSHIQLLSPERLKAKTGLNFVQLAVPATGPKEQLVLVDWFLRNRQSPAQALILSADHMWCTSDPEMPNDKPFPFWLFSASPPEYARGLLRFDLLEEVPRRLGYVLGNKAERARADGYWDYEPEYIRQGFETDLGLRERLERRPGDQAANPTGQFPVAEALRKAISSLPQEVALVLVFPPVYQALLPRPGTARANSEASCKAAIREAVAEHAKSTVIDWRVDRAENRSAVHFFDQTHYRQPIARALESEIADALKRMR